MSEAEAHPEREIFVFGSNRAGRHGKGAALAAMRWHGAIYGKGEGLQGFAYAIPTKSETLRVLPLSAIRDSVTLFRLFALTHPEMRFRLTPIGCGLAGYSPREIAPMFRDAPKNILLPPEFEEALSEPQS